jgi:predicted enzyme related to lactoylglutathione lyase
MSQPEHNFRMDYIEFPATDIAATKRFYHQVFGWEFKDWGPGYTSFHDGRLAGGFNSESQPAGTDGTKTRGVLVVLYAASLDDTYRKVKAASGRIDRPRNL